MVLIVSYQLFRAIGWKNIQPQQLFTNATATCPLRELGLRTPPKYSSSTELWWRRSRSAVDMPPIVPEEPESLSRKAGLAKDKVVSKKYQSIYSPTEGWSTQLSSDMLSNVVDSFFNFNIQLISIQQCLHHQPDMAKIWIVAVGPDSLQLSAWNLPLQNIATMPWTKSVQVPSYLCHVANVCQVRLLWANWAQKECIQDYLHEKRLSWKVTAILPQDEDSTWKVSLIFFHVDRIKLSQLFWEQESAHLTSLFAFNTTNSFKQLSNTSSRLQLLETTGSFERRLKQFLLLWPPPLWTAAFASFIRAGLCIEEGSELFLHCHFHSLWGQRNAKKSKPMCVGIWIT